MQMRGARGQQSISLESEDLCAREPAIGERKTYQNDHTGL
jgi:hypothetical protein